jgi:uridine kinase
MSDVFILVGSPSSGKTWVSSQLRGKFQVIEHDHYSNKGEYIRELGNAAKAGDKPILGNTPFGLSEIMESLQDRGLEVKPVFIIEDPNVLKQRYQQRDGKEIPQGHLTRQNTYLERARELNAFFGTSSEVLNHLKES